MIDVMKNMVKFYCIFVIFLLSIFRVALANKNHSFWFNNIIHFNSDHTSVENSKDYADFINNELKLLSFENKHEDISPTPNSKLHNNQHDDDSSCSQSDTPVLFLDVNFGNGEITRIVMYENDKPEELAEAFWLENNLDLEKQEKLVKIIYQQLETVLEKIEEESEETNIQANL